jgi:hypothetical protein
MSLVGALDAAWGFHNGLFYLNFRIPQTTKPLESGFDL